MKGRSSKLEWILFYTYPPQILSGARRDIRINQVNPFSTRTEEYGHHCKGLLSSKHPEPGSTTNVLKREMQAQGEGFERAVRRAP